MIHELRAVWHDTRMIVLCAISGALYAAVLIPFKVVPLIPGVTELRPANAIPIVCSFLFGPAAGWGSAIGNLIGDFFGGVGPGDVFGFAANLVYGYLPYKIWALIGCGQSPVDRSPLGVAKYVMTCFCASILCADIVGWGDSLLGLRPFAVLGNLIVFNNMLASCLLAPFLLAAIYPRVRAGHLLYSDLMVLPSSPCSFARRLAGLVMLVFGGLSAWVLGNLVSAGFWVPGFLPSWASTPPYGAAVGIVVTPFLVIGLVGASWL